MGKHVGWSTLELTWSVYGSVAIMSRGQNF